MINNIKFYFFTSYINDLIKKNILKFKNIAIIYKPEFSKSTDHQQLNNIKKFTKRNKIPLLIIDDIKLALKYKADGFFISSNNKKAYNFSQYTNRNISIIGSAHNTIEYFTKIRQGCKKVMLSPIFYTEKYSVNKIMGVIKYNLISNGWRANTIALGGINLNNLKKVKMTKATSVAFVSLINSAKIKKPTYLLDKWA
jgi:thiamine monophosphate synthase